METLSVLLFLLSPITGGFFFIALVIRKIKKKPKKKLYSFGLLASFILFILSFVLFGTSTTTENTNETKTITTLEEENISENNNDISEKDDSEKKQSQKSTDEKSVKTNDVKQPDIELNYLKQLKTRDNPVMNGIGTEKIGTYGFVVADKKLTQEITEEDYLEFCNDCVRNSNYNWFTLDFNDGTGIVFSGAIPETGTYGTLDETRCIDEVILYISINSDNTISCIEPSEY